MSVAVHENPDSSPAPAVSSAAVVAHRYAIRALVRERDESTVSLARDEVTGEEVALEILRGSLGAEAHARIRAMIRLRHPRLVGVVDCGLTDEGHPFVVFERPVGPTLSSVVPLIPHDVLRLLVSIADVLAFLHMRGHAHGRVQADHVRLTHSRGSGPLQAKVLEPVTARRAEGYDIRSLPPEATTSGPMPSPQALDLYALGVLMHEAATGSHPFRGDSHDEIQRSKQRPTALHELRPAIPVPLSLIVRDLLAPDPSLRPSSAVEVLGRVREMAESVTYFDSEFVLRAPELVGRESDVGRLREELASMRPDQPASLMVVGSAGQGKTRLCNEALVEMRLQGALVANTRGRGFGGVPYAVLLDLLSSFRRCPTCAPVLKSAATDDLLSLLMTGEGERIQMPALRQRLSSCLADLTKREPVVLFIDDIHQADDASVEALGAVMAEGAPGQVLLLGAYRTDELLRPSLQALVSSSRHLKLTPLASRDIAALIERTLGATPSSGLVDELHQGSEGNPYLVLELLRDAVAKGQIVRKRLAVQLPDRLAADAPQTLADALSRRLARLSVDALGVARILAVVGRKTRTSIVEEAAQLDTNAFDEAIELLHREEIVDITGDTLDLHHMRLGDALLRSMGPAERVAAHAKVAAAIERQMGTGDEHAALLGHHLEAAGERRRAFAYLVRAGDALYERQALDDAGEVYKRAEALLEAAPSEQRAALACTLAERIGRVGFRYDHRSAPPYLERARQLHLQHGLLRTIPALYPYVGAIVANGIGIGPRWRGTRSGCEAIRSSPCAST